MKLGTPGSVSTGTLRDEDLIPRFTLLLEELHPEKAAALKATYEDVYTHLAAGKSLAEVTYDHAQPLTDAQIDEPSMEESASWLMTELFEELEACAPDGHRFGGHEGDGADFGFWELESEPEER